MTQPIIPLGSLIEYGPGPKWTVGMVGVTGGERYYWLRRGNDVAMVPADALKQKEQA
jgi:hypothetical protein